MVNKTTKETKWYFVKHQAIAVCVALFEDHLHELLIVVPFPKIIFGRSKYLERSRVLVSRVLFFFEKLRILIL